MNFLCCLCDDLKRLKFKFEKSGVLFKVEILKMSDKRHKAEPPLITSRPEMKIVKNYFTENIVFKEDF